MGEENLGSRSGGPKYRIGDLLEPLQVAHRVLDIHVAQDLSNWTAALSKHHLVWNIQVGKPQPKRQIAAQAPLLCSP